MPEVQIILEVLSVLLASINLLLSLCKLCTAAGCEGDALAKVSDISEDFYFRTVFITELQNIHSLID